MRAFDRHAIERAQIPGIVLMENAGRGATDVVERCVLGGNSANKRVVIVCGTGNNGGDGFVMARHLALRGASVSVLVIGDAARVNSDARVALDAWIGLGGVYRSMNPETPASAWVEALVNADVIVDALFGTGLERPVIGPFADAVHAMNNAPVPRFSVDLPSGLDADTGQVRGAAVRATATATFAHPKLGLLTPTGASLSGQVFVVDIGVPASLVYHVGVAAQKLEASDLRSWIAPRDVGAHKTTAGHVLVLAGSRGKAGAAQLVARGAMRAGAGLATIATWPKAARSVEEGSLEVMTLRLDPHRIAGSVDSALKGKTAVAIGPGFGVTDDAHEAVLHVIQTWQGPLVVDADAITLLASAPEALKDAFQAVITPHPGELGRLLGKSTHDIEEDRFSSARDAARATGAVVVLKGAHSIIASPDGRLAVSPIACPVLATAGSGDVLTGIVSALACSLAPFEAACAGVLLHGLAGEEWSREHGNADRGMLASELADGLPNRIATWRKVVMNCPEEPAPAASRRR